jgi:hypothetical protein
VTDEAKRSPALPTLREQLHAWQTGGNAIAACLLRRLDAEDTRCAAPAARGPRR